MVALEIKGTPRQTWPIHPHRLLHNGTCLYVWYVWGHPSPLWRKEAAQRGLKCVVSHSHSLGAGSEGSPSPRTLTSTPPARWRRSARSRAVREEALRAPLGAPRDTQRGPPGPQTPLSSPTPRAGPGETAGGTTPAGPERLPAHRRGLPPTAPRGASSPPGLAAPPTAEAAVNRLRAKTICP